MLGLRKGWHGEREQHPYARDGFGRDLRGGSLSAIARTIAEGVPSPKNYRSPMPPMGGAQLSRSELDAVAAYVWAIGHQDKQVQK